MPLNDDYFGPEFDDETPTAPFIPRTTTLRYAELPPAVTTADVCPSCLSHDIEDFDRTDAGLGTEWQHCNPCGKVFKKGN